MRLSERVVFAFFFSSRRRHTRLQGDWSSDVCSSDLCSPAYCAGPYAAAEGCQAHTDRKSTRLNSSHLVISYAVFCLKKKKKDTHQLDRDHSPDRAAPDEPPSWLA